MKEVGYHPITATFRKWPVKYQVEEFRRVENSDIDFEMGG